jgi:hypothetical protein
MPSQLLFPGFPVGASRIGAVVSILEKDGRVAYFVGADLFHAHHADDGASRRLILAMLVEQGHVRACDLEQAPLCIPHRTVMRWLKQLRTQGIESFYRPARRSGARVLTPEVCARCEALFAQGLSVGAVAQQANLNESTLRKAIGRGVVRRHVPDAAGEDVSGEAGSTKSGRSRSDAEAAAGMGTACTRTQERVAAAMGLAAGAAARFERCDDVAMGGLLAGLPALCANGLLSGLGKHLSLPQGFYSCLHILLVLGFMALARIRRPEGLRHLPPGELGKVAGLDRVPEVRTLREKIRVMAGTGDPEAWMKELARAWMEEDPHEAGYLYVDGHVRVYYGDTAHLPRRYVSRERLCLRGTTDYWVNDALGRPFFVVSKAVTGGLAEALLTDIVPELLASVPGQPDASQLEADPLLHRFVTIFDREGANYKLLAALWAQRIGALTYRKNVMDAWPESEFTQVEVPVPGGGATRMLLAQRETQLRAGKESLPVTEVRRLTPSGHQTAVICSARRLDATVIAGRMFARWCQENFFAYMMQHYDIDGLVEYGAEALPDTVEVVNPARRTLDKAVAAARRTLQQHQAKLGALVEKDDASIQAQAECVEHIQAAQAQLDQLRAQRKQTPRKVALSQLPEDQRPTQLRPLNKILTDSVKMIAYRSETALMALLLPHLNKEAEARALIRELLVSAADIEPDETAGTLTVRIHRMACPAHDTAIAALLQDLNHMEFHHPETGATMIYTLT